MDREIIETYVATLRTASRQASQRRQICLLHPRLLSRPTPGPASPPLVLYVLGRQDQRLLALECPAGPAPSDPQLGAGTGNGIVQEFRARREHE